ncbi:hypothetical protein GGI00_005881, partial [Coemansia sp. RSA 2681]
MIKLRAMLLALTLACLGLLTLTAYRYRDDFKDRSLSNLSNEDAGGYGGLLNILGGGGIGGMGDLWQGDTHVVMGKMANETLRAQLGRRTWYLMH